MKHLTKALFGLLGLSLAVPSLAATSYTDRRGGVDITIPSSYVLPIANGGTALSSVGASGTVLQSTGTGLRYAVVSGVEGAVSLQLGTTATGANPYAYDDATTGLFSGTASTISFAISGVEQMRLSASGYLGLGTTSPQAPVHISSSQSFFLLDSYGANSVIIGRRANGTSSSPTTLTPDQEIFSIGGRGYDGAAWSTIASSLISLKSTSTWSPSDHSSYTEFYTTPVGSIARTLALKIGSDKSITLPGLTTSGIVTVTASGLLSSTSTISTSYISGLGSAALQSATAFDAAGAAASAQAASQPLNSVLTSVASGTYTGNTNISLLGTVTAGTWHGSTLTVPYGGSGATTLTGYLKGNGTSAFTASATIPYTDVSGLGTIATQAANSVSITGGSISGVTLSASTATVTSLIASSATAAGLTLSSITGSTQCLQVNSSGIVSGAGLACGSGTGSGSMTYPSVGIAVSTGTAWGSSLTDNHTQWDYAYTTATNSAVKNLVSGTFNGWTYIACDGTDKYSTINSALSSLNNVMLTGTPGVAVCQNSGTLQVTATGQKLYGTNVILRQTATYHGIYITGNSAEVQGLWVDGNGLGGDIRGIVVSADYVKVRNNKAYSWQTAGIAVGDYGETHHPYYTEVTGNETYNNRQIGIWNYNAHYGVITNNFSHNNSYEGITVDVLSSHNAVEQNQLITNGASGGFGQIGAGYNSHYNTFKGNILKSTITGIQGIGLNGDYNVIEGNQIETVSGRGIYLGYDTASTSYGGAGYNVVQNNQITSTGTASIFVDATSTGNIIGVNKYSGTIVDNGTQTNSHNLYAGKLGIGTTSPNYEITLLSSSTAGNSPFIRIENTSGATPGAFGPGFSVLNNVAGKHGYVVVQNQSSGSEFILANSASPYTTYFSLDQTGGIALPQITYMTATDTGLPYAVAMDANNNLVRVPINAVGSSVYYGTVNSGNTSQLAYYSSTGTVLSGNSYLSQSGTSPLIVSFNPSALPAPLSSSALQLSATNSGVTRAELFGFGAPPVLTFRTASGTAASPTAIVADQMIGYVGAYPYIGSVWNGTGLAGIGMYSLANATATNAGTYVTIHTTPSGSVTRAAALKINADKTLDIYGNYVTINGIRAISLPAGDTTSLAIGASALGAQTGTGLNNFAVGPDALANCTTCEWNTAFGNAALGSNVTGNGQVAIGGSAMWGYQGTGWDANTAVGNSALNTATFYNNNTAVGNSSGYSTSGSYNTYLGSAAGYSVTSGANNTIIGAGVGSTTLTTGSSNILIGFSSAVDTPASGTSNLLNIGNKLKGYVGTAGPIIVTDNSTAITPVELGGTMLQLVSADGKTNRLEMIAAGNARNSLTIKTASGTLTSPTSPASDQQLFSIDAYPYITGSGWANTLAAGMSMRTLEVTSTASRGTKILFYTTATGSASYGTALTLNGNKTIAPGALGSATASALCYGTGNVLSTCSSSKRYKKDIKAAGFGLKEVLQLKPVKFRWKKDNGEDVGFIAEDVAKINPLLITYRDDQIEGVKYDQMGAVYAAGIQELYDIVQQQQAVINRQQKRLDALYEAIHTSGIRLSESSWYDRILAYLNLERKR